MAVIRRVMSLPPSGKEGVSGGDMIQEVPCIDGWFVLSGEVEKAGDRIVKEIPPDVAMDEEGIAVAYYDFMGDDVMEVVGLKKGNKVVDIETQTTVFEVEDDSDEVRIAIGSNCLLEIIGFLEEPIRFTISE